KKKTGNGGEGGAAGPGGGGTGREKREEPRARVGRDCAGGRRQDGQRAQAPLGRRVARAAEPHADGVERQAEQVEPRRVIALPAVGCDWKATLLVEELDRLLVVVEEVGERRRAAVRQQRAQHEGGGEQRPEDGAGVPPQRRHERTARHHGSSILPWAEIRAIPAFCAWVHAEFHALWPRSSQASHFGHFGPSARFTGM